MVLCVDCQYPHHNQRRKAIISASQSPSTRYRRRIGILPLPLGVMNIDISVLYQDLRHSIIQLRFYINRPSTFHPTVEIKGVSSWISELPLT